MASLSRPPSLRFDERLPIVLLPDDEDETDRVHGPETAMDSETELEQLELRRKLPVDRNRDRDQDPTPEPRMPPPPQHPIPSMQGAFAESLVEATGGSTKKKPKLRSGDAKARREELLDQDKADGPPVAQWRFRPGQINHELRRLMAQISFGVYLLLNGMANSQISVFSILQGHIDEVDEFLETTLEDLALATKDLEERVAHLKLPMDNMEVFERMLEDRNFRLQILEGNQKIEHIVARTEVALEQTVRDLAEGVDATKEFTIYLAGQEHGRWRRDRPDVIDIFAAMKGNTDGWLNAFIDLQAKASHLDQVIGQLNGMISEMERRAGQVSRRTRFSIQPYSSPMHSPRGSDASSLATPPASPPAKVPASPPRLSLRLSKLQAEPLFSFDIPLGRISLSPPERRPPSPQEAPAQEKPAIVTEEPTPPLSPPARNPKRLSERPIPRLETTTEKAEEEPDLYILQPRTYTPQPPSPLPSPRVFDDRPEPKTGLRTPRIPQTESLNPFTRVSVQQTISPPKPRVVQHQLRAQASKPKLVAIAPRTDSKASPSRAPPPIPQPVPEPHVRPPPSLAREVEPEPEREPQPQPEAQPRQRTSLRQRVSLKTNPPEAIHVPPPNAPELRRHPYPSPSPAGGGAFHAHPDSAYGSDVERHAVHSMASREYEPSISDFPRPVVRPALIPSPHSDQQFFRPVQASPYSPLQQRPHTSGTVNPGPRATTSHSNYQHHHQGVPGSSRNLPSAMGMSMLSNVTTMTSESGASRLKKKRSAFGWLKKAFSLDEEERAAFEQKRREQTRNPYYDARSPLFLDGKRLPQPPRHH
ncbi:hypothetical protein B0H66DRAFT_46958 [Apodospora peruviana]|uniref:Uncharacterized protein n=1 Tax=Apodospora peruviana TaxID=516989 RepID=A0AAE0IS41_9PEZI|nr:hypothetical protein B0H66DRAFT_46958 [Apodospora peruviana]